MTDSAAGQQTGPTLSSRRALLGLGVLGAALAARSGVASATGLSDDDLATAELVVGAEMAAAGLYTAALEAGADPVLFGTLRDQHRGFADRVSGLGGVRARGGAAAWADARRDAFAADPATAGLDLENSLAATHAQLVASIESPAFADVTAAIAAMESRHAVALALAAGRSDDLDAMFTNPAAPLAEEA